MARGILDIDLDAIVANWRALGRLSGSARAGAVVKANAYGLGVAPVARALAKAGARLFFVVSAEEGAELRSCLGPEIEIMLLSGHMSGDTDLISGADLIPLLSSPGQVARHRGALPGRRYGIQLDTGMNRLGIGPGDWQGLAPVIAAEHPALVMSHLACADDAENPGNAAQLSCFRKMTGEISAERSLAATGGILLGPDYHFDVTRPGIGIYGCRPFAEGRPVVRLTLPVIQIRHVPPGQAVGYGGTWVAGVPSRIALVAAGYADGLLRALTGRGSVMINGQRCPMVGRVSMDSLAVDITNLGEDPEMICMIGDEQPVDAVADMAGTIGYEILTSFGARYEKTYREAGE
ncbi:MAG: alanine racemase [Rhodobacteraceae bacterium]|nr:alanine racemase [Paracoccaceae bacterium]